jgi:hypothetical protein
MRSEKFYTACIVRTAYVIRFLSIVPNDKAVKFFIILLAQTYPPFFLRLHNLHLHA